MSKHKCCEMVSGTGLAFARSYPCGLNAKFEHEGKHYCGTHYPPNVEARNEKNRIKYEAKYQAEKAMREAPFKEIRMLTEQRNDLLEALKDAVQVMEPFMQNDGYIAVRVGLARAAIDKAEGKA